MKFLSMELGDDGSLVIQYLVEKDQSEHIGEVRTLYIRPEGLAQWEHAAYYYAELMQDIDEMMGWIDKYQRGVVA